jgi:hypothetical protein
MAMNISKSNLQSRHSSVQSGAPSTNARVTHQVCAIFLASLFCSGAQAANVLVNPGAEAGNLTGWKVSNTGYTLVVSTNGTIPNTTNNYSAHSGEYMFEQFDADVVTAYIYQDYPAIAGSQWSASVWAICYASNYFDSAYAYMSVAFHDTNGNVVLDDPVNPDPGTFGVYGSVILDPNAPMWGGGWIIAPPPAIDGSGWLYLPATNFYYHYIPANTNGAPGTNIESGMAILVSTNLTAPPGTAFVRYQLEYDSSGTDAGAVYWDDCVLNKLNFSDPDITTNPVAAMVYSGSPASFTVGARKAAKLEVLKYQWQLNGINLPPAGNTNDIAGTTTNSTLTLTNCQLIDAGLYSVVVSDTNGSIRSVPVTLTVLCPCPGPHPPNRLGNPGFENAPSWVPWGPFNCYFTGVHVHSGYWAALVGASGVRDSGFYQVIKGVTPGSVWKAGGWAYISSSNDFFGGNTCRIQVWFKDANGVNIPAPTYESFKIYGWGYTNADAQYTNIDTSSPYYGQVMYHDQLPRDTWCYLPVTNIVNNGGIGLGDDLPINTFPDGDFVVPTNANIAEINFQVYQYCPIAADNPQPDLMGCASDAVYWDDMELIQVLPVTNLTASVSGTNVNLWFWGIAGLDYKVLYKTNLTDSIWNVLTNIPTIEYSGFDIPVPVTVSDPIAPQSRFYRVQAH